MIHQGQTMRVEFLADGIAGLCFDAGAGNVNKFDYQTLAELPLAVAALQQCAGLRGVVVYSALDDFIVGANIGEFLQRFREGEQALLDTLRRCNATFNAFEDLPVPSVVAINGVALGGGFEMCLACDLRVMAEGAQIGLPETRLGIMPGFGGSVRLPRIIGADNAIEWIAGAKEQDAATALKVGAVDAVVEPARVLEAATDLCRRAIDGEIDWQARRRRKLVALRLNPIEQMLCFESAKAFVAAQAGPHYPAPVAAVKAMQKAAGMAREAAQEVEARAFVPLAQSPVAHSLIQLFLNDQYLKHKARRQEAAAHPVARMAVLGAGIMGGGIAAQAAGKGVPVLLKDIRAEALQAGLDEATRLLAQKVERGRMTPLQMAGVLNAIQPTLSWGDFANTDLVVEAVVEHPAIKQQVLAEVEAVVGEDCILTSNTSTIAIDLLASALKRPHNFCGMHFFNPVHRMPLVEVIRGKASSEAAVASTVALARRMGKTPVVVRDCPGFLVNRILLPYFEGFAALLAAGIDFRRIDALMERFGWPMGPALLLDVVGLDTAHHARRVMAAGYPDRMGLGTTPVDALYAAGRLGQKNGRGFYLWQAGRDGKLQKTDDPQVDALLAAQVSAPRNLEDSDIIDLLMIPLCLEAVRCLEEGIVGTPAELDTALVYGLGFPPFLGGALQYIDQLGAQAFVARARSHAVLGPLYQPGERLQQMAAQGARFYP